MNLEPDSGFWPQPSHVTLRWKLGTVSISAMSPVQLHCVGKSTVRSRPLGLMLDTMPTLRCVTEPHLYLGVVTWGRTRTRSPTLSAWLLWRLRGWLRSSTWM